MQTKYDDDDDEYTYYAFLWSFLGLSGLAINLQMSMKKLWKLLEYWTPDALAGAN